MWGEVPLPLRRTGRLYMHRAGLLTPGCKRCLSDLPISTPEAFSSEVLDSGMLPCYPLIIIRGFARGQALTSYSSATVAGFHRLPYSACPLRDRPPGANSHMLFVDIVYERGEDGVKHQYRLPAHCPSGQLTRSIEKTDTTIERLEARTGRANDETLVGATLTDSVPVYVKFQHHIKGYISLRNKRIFTRWHSKKIFSGR